MRDNTVSTAKAGLFEGDCWKAFDSFPREVRRALHESVNNWASFYVSAVLAEERQFRRSRDLAAAVAARISAFDLDEVATFSRRQRDRTGHDTPHVQAGATVQRYDGRREGAMLLAVATE